MCLSFTPFTSGEVFSSCQICCFQKMAGNCYLTSRLFSCWSFFANFIAAIHCRLEFPQKVVVVLEANPGKMPETIQVFRKDIRQFALIPSAEATWSLTRCTSPKHWRPVPRRLLGNLLRQLRWRRNWFATCGSKICHLILWFERICTLQWLGNFEFGTIFCEM